MDKPLVYGHDAGLMNTGTVQLNLSERALRVIDPPLAASVHYPGTFAEATTWSDARWSEVAVSVANEIVSRGMFPIGIDAALSCSADLPGRPWEWVARAFLTPPATDRWAPAEGQYEEWAIMARVWTEVAWRLVKEHGFQLYAGPPVADGTKKLVVEVYPTATLRMLGGNPKRTLRKSTSDEKVRLREDACSLLQLTWMPVPGLRSSPLEPIERRLTPDEWDAAICAITAAYALNGHARFVGEPYRELEGATPAFDGGGIAVPWHHTRLRSRGSSWRVKAS